MRSVVDKLMKSCQRLSSDMQSMVNDLTGQSVDIAFKPSIIFINFRLTSSDSQMLTQFGTDCNCR